MKYLIDRTVLVPVLVASITISATLQWVADSGLVIDLTRLALKCVIGLISYVLVFLLLNGRSLRGWKLLLLVALCGALVNAALSTFLDTYFSYINDYPRGVFSFSDWSGVWIATLFGRVMLSPLFMVLFLGIALPLHSVMLLLNRGFRPPHLGKMTIRNKRGQGVNGVRNKRGHNKRG